MNSRVEYTSVDSGLPPSEESSFLPQQLKHLVSFWIAKVRYRGLERNQEWLCAGLVRVNPYQHRTRLARTNLRMAPLGAWCVRHRPRAASREQKQSLNHRKEPDSEPIGINIGYAPSKPGVLQRLPKSATTRSFLWFRADRSQTSWQLPNRSRDNPGAPHPG